MISDEALLAEYHRLTKWYRRRPSLRQYDAYAKYSANTLTSRFGGDRNLRWSYTKYLVVLRLREMYGEREEWRELSYAAPPPGCSPDLGRRKRLPAADL